jgi:hypothetical protein
MSAKEMLDLIDHRKPLHSSEDRVVQFMIASCDLITPWMPPVAVSALEVARRYWRGEARESELERARVECWEYLDGIGAATSTDDPQVCATRAVICLLHPALPQNDLFDLTHWFIDLTRNVTDIDHQQSDILSQLFGDVLDGGGPRNPDDAVR